VKPYQPSNGDEGIWFMDEFCMQCTKCNPNPDLEPQCMILCHSMAYNINDEEYPKEWVQEDGMYGRCTAHIKWDWDTMGNPEDPKGKYYVMPNNPDQTEMPL